MSDPIVLLLGRPNVGKSTLFNRLTHTKAALIDDRSGVTRDWIARPWSFDGHRYELRDLCGFQEREQDPVLERSQAAMRALWSQAACIVFVVDARAGITEADRWLASELRPLGIPVVFAANKAESQIAEAGAWAAAELGWTPIPISGEHGLGIDALEDAVAKAVAGAADAGGRSEDVDVGVAILGRPNAGKSTLLNTLLREERATVSDVPGTTRDPVDATGRLGAFKVRFVDTAGIRRKRSIDDGLEAASVSRSLQAAERADVIFYLIHAEEGITQQDQTLLARIVGYGKGLVICYSQWDRIGDPETRLAELERERDRMLPFVEFAPRITLSSADKHNLGRLVAWTEKLLAELDRAFSTSTLNKDLAEILARNPPPAVRVRASRRRARVKPLKVLYATQTGTRPLRIRVFGSVRTSDLPESYKRFLQRRLREVLGIQYVPILIEFRGRRNRPERDEAS